MDGTGCLLGFVFFQALTKIHNFCSILTKYGSFEQKHIRICGFEEKSSNSLSESQNFYEKLKTALFYLGYTSYTDFDQDRLLKVLTRFLAFPSQITSKLIWFIKLRSFIMIFIKLYALVSLKLPGMKEKVVFNI